MYRINRLSHGHGCESVRRKDLSTETFFLTTIHQCACAKTWCVTSNSVQRHEAHALFSQRCCMLINHRIILEIGGGWGQQGPLFWVEGCHRHLIGT